MASDFFAASWAAFIVTPVATLVCSISFVVAQPSRILKKRTRLHPNRILFNPVPFQCIPFSPPFLYFFGRFSKVPTVFWLAASAFFEKFSDEAAAFSDLCAAASAFSA